MNDDDLEYILNISPDMSAVDDALANISKQVDITSKFVSDTLLTKLSAQTKEINALTGSMKQATSNANTGGTGGKSIDEVYRTIPIDRLAKILGLEEERVGKLKEAHQFQLDTFRLQEADPSALKEELELRQQMALVGQKSSLLSTQQSMEIDPGLLKERLETEQKLTNAKLEQQVIQKQLNTLVNPSLFKEEIKYKQQLIALNLSRQLVDRKDTLELTTVDSLKKELDTKKEIGLLDKQRALLSIQANNNPDLLKRELDLNRQITIEESKQEVANRQIEAASTPSSFLQEELRYKQQIDSLDLRKHLRLSQEKLLGTTPEQLKEELVLKQRIAQVDNQQQIAREEAALELGPQGIKTRLEQESRLTELKQKQALIEEKIKLGESPESLKSRLALEQQISIVKQKQLLNETKMLEQLGPKHIKERLAVQLQIEASQHRMTINELNAAKDIKAIQQRIAQERELSETQKEVNQATERERRKTETPDVLSKILKVTLGDTIGTAVSGMVGNERDRKRSAPDVEDFMEAIRGKGQGGDTELAHVNKNEKDLLKSVGGSGKINPNTGIREFAGGMPLLNSTGQVIPQATAVPEATLIPEAKAAPKDDKTPAPMPEGMRKGNLLPGIGSLIGGAVAGPIGADLGKMIGEVLPHALAAPAEMATKALSTFSHSLSELGGPLGPIGAGLDLVSAGFETFSGAVKSIPVLGELVGPFLDALGKVPGIIKDITTTLVGFAAKASPGQFLMFQRALEDVQGVIGQSFLPVLELMRIGVRLFGDVLANILPSMSEVREALDPVREGLLEFGSAVREILTEVGPLIRIFFIANIKILIAVLSPLGNAFLYVTKGIAAFLRPLRELMAVLGVDTGLRSSVGAAANPAKIQGLQEYQEQLQTAAYAEPGNTMASVPGNVATISGTLFNILTILEGMSRSGIRSFIEGIVGGGPTSAAQAAARANTGALTTGS